MPENALNDAAALRPPKPLPEFCEKGCGKPVWFNMRYMKLCKECIDAHFEAKHKIDRFNDRLRCSGISPRHNKYTSWDGLKGPAPYIAAVKHVRDFCENGQSVLAVIGGRGSGKTQALCVGVRATLASDRQAKIVHIGELCGDLRRRYDGGGDGKGDAEQRWIDFWKEIDLLIIDEIGEFVAGDNTRACVARLIDKRYMELKPTIVCGNLVSGQLVECVGASTADRCGEGGGIVQFIGWPSFRSTQGGA